MKVFDKAAYTHAADMTDDAVVALRLLAATAARDREVYSIMNELLDGGRAAEVLMALAVRMVVLLEYEWGEDLQAKADQMVFMAMDRVAG